MSVVTFPRRAMVERPAAPVRAHGRRLRPWHLLATRSLTVRLAIPLVLAVGVVLAGTSLAAQRQVQLQTMQNELTAQQAHYAALVAQLTAQAAPGRVAIEAGHLHLVLPTSVQQITTVPLDKVLADPHLMGTDTVTSRVQR